MSSNEDILRSRVYKFYSDHMNKGKTYKGKTYTLKHFMEEGVPRRTVYAIFQSFDNNLPASRKSGSGSTPKIFTPEIVKSLRRRFDHKDGISQRQAANMYQCSQGIISKKLKKLEISCRKKMRIPDQTEKQINDAKTLCGRLYRKFSKFSWILDDEPYFTLTHSNIHGSKNFNSSNVSKTPARVKFSKKKKFEKKVGVDRYWPEWIEQAID
uniref:Uncharacterized protein n=1 Tax=Acrobeloides nanus TaxID=290746 RepID=A0A914CP62_9BILA